MKKFVLIMIIALLSYKAFATTQEEDFAKNASNCGLMNEDIAMQVLINPQNHLYICGEKFTPALQKAIINTFSPNPIKQAWTYWEFNPQQELVSWGISASLQGPNEKFIADDYLYNELPEIYAENTFNSMDGSIHLDAQTQEELAEGGEL